MSVILEQWDFAAAQNRNVTVLPDGCRDLIMRKRPGAAPIWFVSDLDSQAYQVRMRRGDCFYGFRLHPGVRVEEEALLHSLTDGMSAAQIRERLHSYTSRNANVTEALACLASGVVSVAQAAAELGVQPRRLQRLLRHQTQRSPAFWLRLARLRKAAMRMTPRTHLAALAYDLGFADQSHMTREFRSWFGVTPHQIKAQAGWQADNMVAGYAG
ncbi:MAG: AraC family transcriptional regulator [Rhodobacterales bacterium]|nr:MAG: AraC family transcriptional regulator [Rhodobacterales bacterium]